MSCAHQFEIVHATGGDTQRCKFCGMDAWDYQQQRTALGRNQGCICPPGANIACNNPLCPRGGAGGAFKQT